MDEAQKKARLTRLMTRVRNEVEEGAGRYAARVAVPAFAGHDTIQALADDMGEERSLLTLCLSVHRNRPSRRIRRALDDYLELPRGGMDMVLALVEELEVPDARG